MAEQPALLGEVVAPGDAVQKLPQVGRVRIGPGLRAADGFVTAQKVGVVRQTKSGKLWLEGRQKRYIPSEEDLVVGVVIDRRGENFLVDVGGPFPGQLPLLAFEGATRRNRPNLAPGDALYARVVSAHRDSDPVLSCVDAAGRAAGFGALKAGLIIQVPLPRARALLAVPPAPLLAALGACVEFEVAVGMNGRLWVAAGGAAATAKVAAALRTDVAPGEVAGFLGSVASTQE